MEHITRLAVFPVHSKNGWLFRVSVSNKVNIMVLAYNPTIEDSFTIRFFVNSDIAKAWVDEVVEGKHLD